MKHSITYKQKNKLLLIGLFPLALFVYSFAIKKTVSLISTVKETEQKILAANDAPQKSKELKEKIKKLDDQLGTLHREAHSDQDLLEMITGYCKKEGTILREFPEKTSEIREEYIIETNRLVIQGTFQPLLNLIYLLEQKKNLGKVASVDYSLKKDSKTREEILITTIYLQNIRKK